LDKFVASYDEENNVLYIKIRGILDVEDLHKLIPLYEGLLEKRNRRYILVDMSESAKFDANTMTKEMRNAYKDLIKVMNPEKSAIFGLSPGLRMAARIVLVLSGKSDVTHFFKNKEEALLWLKGDGK
jgi:hypothetical protein